MNRARTNSCLLTRKFVAAAVLCLFVIKGLSFLGMTVSLATDPEGTNPIILSAVLGAHCENAQNKADPGHQHISHTECCIFCSSLSRDAVALDANLLTVIVGILSPKEEAKPIVYFVKNTTSSQPPGWANSWSATAPPSA
jgi:hypothetical protein